jgi:hypothetical protein
VVKDATADYSDEMMHGALDINIPNYASAVVTTKESRRLYFFSLSLCREGRAAAASSPPCSGTRLMSAFV